MTSMKSSLPPALVSVLILVAVLSGIPAGTPAVGAAPDGLSDIRELLSDERYVEAESRLSALAEEELAKDESEWDPEIFRLLARTRLSLGDLDAAQNDIDRALDLAEEDGRLWELRGDIAFARGDNAIATRDAANTIKSWFAEAQVNYSRALDARPESEDIRWKMGWSRELQEYPDEAEQLYREQIEKFPSNPAGYRRLGALLSARANATEGGTTEKAAEIRERAIAMLDEGIEKAGEDAGIHYLKGIAELWRRDSEAAKAAYVAAVRADPAMDKAWRDLAGRKLLDVEGLKKLAREVLETHPKNPVASLWLGYYLNEQGKYDQALEVLIPSLEKYRENFGVYQQAFRAVASIYGGDTKRGVELLRQLHELYLLSGDAANNIALYHRDVTRDAQKSLEWYLKALERAPESQDFLNDTAVVYLYNLKGQEAKSLPMLLLVVDQVESEGRPAERGYWDALENLAYYHTHFEPDPAKVVKYADMRYVPVNGVEPYNMNPAANNLGKAAKKKLEQND